MRSQIDEVKYLFWRYGKNITDAQAIQIINLEIGAIATRQPSVINRLILMSSRDELDKALGATKGTNEQD